MRFVAIATAVGLVGLLLAVSVGGAGTPAEPSLSAALTPPAATGSVLAAPERAAPAAIRLIDLKSGATCKMGRPAAGGGGRFAPVPFGPDCARLPGLARAAYWRLDADGGLIVADAGGDTVLTFAPREDILYESVYPATELITIVPAKS